MICENERCRKEFTPKEKAHNVKYCSKKCYNQAFYWRVGKKFQEEKGGKYEKGKLQCPVCKKYYHKLISHTYQKHELKAREFKEYYGLDVKKGLLSEKARDTHRKIVLDNWELNMENLRKGRGFWFKKGDTRAGRYVRSKETMERLRLQGLKIAKLRKENAI